MVENSMVMPTGVNTNRNRQRRVVFYGRVSSINVKIKVPNCVHVRIPNS